MVQPPRWWCSCPRQSSPATDINFPQPAPQVVSATAAALLCACVVVLVAVGNEGVVPREAELLAVPRQASLRGAIAQLASAEHASKGRMEQLAPMNWLEKIYGRDNTYDFAGISA